MTSVDELLPNPDEELELSPDSLLAAVNAADEIERASLEQELIEAGFDEVSITEQGIGKWKFDLVHRGHHDDVGEALGRLEELLVQFGLVQDQMSLVMEIDRSIVTASFLSFREMPPGR